MSEFPPEYHRRLRADRMWWAGVLGISGLAAALFSYGAIFSNGPIFLTTVVVAIFLLCALSGFHNLREDHEELARIVPYFERDVPGVDTFFRSGHALARHCLSLDGIAAEADAMPISAFGFSDKFPNERPCWHDSDLGLKTVMVLIKVLSEHPELVADAEGLMADLARMESKLQEACRLRVRFCLHLRIDSAYTALEFERRVGRYYASAPAKPTPKPDGETWPPPPRVQEREELSDGHS